MPHAAMLLEIVPAAPHAEKPADHFLSGADFGEGSVPTRIEVDCQRSVMGIQILLVHAAANLSGDFGAGRAANCAMIARKGSSVGFIGQAEFILPVPQAAVAWSHGSRRWIRRRRTVGHRRSAACR